VDFINDICIEQNIDEYEQAVEEEDGGLFFENDDGLAVETDDDCVEYHEEEPPPSANPHPSRSSGNTAEPFGTPITQAFGRCVRWGKHWSMSLCRRRST
jgi:hypothetical protein